ncbi:MAG: carboxypeptidase regulatory-like domain-containing protein [Clostridia bacterium]|nr:carboxypeptidase regulatory-like domain-containing protein [Clostridia bacterium]
MKKTVRSIVIVIVICCLCLLGCGAKTAAPEPTGPSLEAVYRLEGVLADQTGAVTGADVRVYIEEAFYAQCQTDETGAFVIADLPIGGYCRLEAVCPGEGDDSQTSCVYLVFYTGYDEIKVCTDAAGFIEVYSPADAQTLSLSFLLGEDGMLTANP